MIKYRIRFYIDDDALNYLDIIDFNEARKMAENFSIEGERRVAVLCKIEETIIQQYISKRSSYQDSYQS